MAQLTTILPDLTSTLVVAIEISKSSWLTAAHIPGLSGVKAKQQVETTAEAVVEAIARLTRRAAGAGVTVQRTVVCYEAATLGFGWRASFGSVAWRCSSFSQSACPWTGAREGQKPTRST